MLLRFLEQPNQNILLMKTDRGKVQINDYFTYQIQQLVLKDITLIVGDTTKTTIMRNKIYC